MACPSGCLNGGGQIKPKVLGREPAEVLTELETMIANPENRVLRLPENNENLARLYAHTETEKLEKLTKTQFQPLKSDPNAFNIKW